MKLILKSRYTLFFFIFTVTCAILLALAATTNKQSFAGQFHTDIYKPAAKFDFIKRFLCISDLLGEEQWTKQNGRSFDPTGVALTNGKKHPVNICHYALFCYDAYHATGDDRFKKSFLVNARVLLDSTFYHRTDEDKIAYPYDVRFHDLNPPWYSALAQSEAISVLIRYYAITREKLVLRTIIELKNYMVSPQKGNCGTMNITPEGYEWYEEYPNSKQERQVLNGFLLSIVAFHEYCKLFPNDTATYRLYQNTIETVKHSFKFYDTGSWLKYNRGDQRLVNNGYMKWQTLEMKYLYQLTGDIYFKKLMMLIATYCFNKEFDTPGSLLRNYDFSVPMVPNSSGKLVFQGKRTTFDLKKEKPDVKLNCNVKQNEISKLFDNNVFSFVNFCAGDSIYTGTHDIEFNFSGSKQISNMKIQYVGLDSLSKPDVAVYYKDSLKGSQGYQKIKFTFVEKNISFMNYFFDDIEATSVKIEIDKTPIGKVNKFRVCEIAMTSPPEKVKSDFWHYTTTSMKADSDKMAFNFKYSGIKDYMVFYRSSDNIQLLSKSQYDPMKAVNSNEVIINKAKGLYYQFLIVCVPENDNASIRDIEFDPIQ